MNILIDVAFISASLVLLYFGAQWLVSGSSRLASAFGISQLVIGLTVVAFGTSAPELVVSLTASLNDQTGLALGNVIGSNIFNILLILGITSIISPVWVDRKIIRSDIPLVILLSGVFAFMMYNGHLMRWEGIVLLAGIVVYTAYMLLKSTSEPQTELPHKSAGNIPAYSMKQKGWFLLLIAAGLVLLIAGSRLLVYGAVDMARTWGVNETIIGLTIVSAGTSLPELATSLVAALKKESDIAIGNIVGSNIFNILAIGGTAVVVNPTDISGFSVTDIVFMVGSAILLFPLAYTGSSIRRLEGALLLAAYGAYLFLIWP